MKALRIAAQFALYVPLMAILAYFSSGATIEKRGSVEKYARIAIRGT